MKMLLVILLSLSINAWAQNHDHSHLPEGGRRSLHGMVLFGAGTYFLEHIPTLAPPHDFQIVAEVALKDSTGKIIQRDFSNAMFTFKPADNFSLNDYVAGRLKSFEGTIHDGGFEQGGPVLSGFERVVVEVKELKFVRQLPAASKQSTFEISDGKNVFETSVIVPSKNLQMIRNKTTNKILWCVQGPDFFEPCVN